MAKRKAIGKKVRFEVFKRDSFKCQYCGRSAPDVVLQADHIEPVSKGGDNEIMNLITSCFDCNSGKRDIPLSDDSALVKQRAQLEELNERRSQLQMMMKWRKGLKNIKQDELIAVADYWKERVSGFFLNELGLATMGKLLRKYPTTEVLEAIDIVIDRYIKLDEENTITRESAEIALNKLGGTLAVRAMPEAEQKARYVRGILRNRFSYVRDDLTLNYVRNAISGGVDPDYLIRLAKEARYWSQWETWMIETIQEAASE